VVEDGFTVFDHDPRVARWAAAAYQAALGLDLKERRHGGTWFVGVDALPNDASGRIGHTPLDGPWQLTPSSWHQAQLSVIYPGYPGRDPGESLAAHRFRLDRDAAHMDGLLPDGPLKRRHLREPHAFILGIPLNAVAASPLVVWPGSHKIMRAAFQDRLAGIVPDNWADEDVTDIYQAARRDVFRACPRVPLPLRPGQAVLLDRHLIHGVAPWAGDPLPEGRMVAYFRPQVTDLRDWL
jgi:hypothetical protein